MGLTIQASLPNNTTFWREIEILDSVIECTKILFVFVCVQLSTDECEANDRSGKINV
jgi:hypothetical protein